MADPTQTKTDVDSLDRTTPPPLPWEDGGQPADMKGADVRGIVDTSPVEHETKSNPDAITGAPASHPLGTGIGSLSAGAAGLAIGTVFGPAGSLVGGAIGAVVGAVAGGLAGKAVAEGVNPSEEDTYWSTNYANRPYVSPGSKYEDYRPAYQYGWESRKQYVDRESFDHAETDMGRDWDKVKGQSTLVWDHAKHAARDAWERAGTAGTHDGRKTSDEGQSEEFRGPTGNG